MHATLIILITVTLIIIPPAWQHIYIHYHMKCSQQSRDISTITTAILQISKLRLSHEEDSASSYLVLLLNLPLEVHVLPQGRLGRREKGLRTSTLQSGRLGFESKLFHLLADIAEPQSSHLSNGDENTLHKSLRRIKFLMHEMCLERYLLNSRCFHNVDCQ